MFSFLLGVLYWLAVYCNSFVFSASFVSDGFVPANAIGELPFGHFLWLWWQALFFSPLALMVHITLLGLCCTIASEDGVKSLALGFIHGLVHICAAASLFWLLSDVSPSMLLKSVLLFACGTLVGGFIFGLYFTLMAYMGLLSNNAFSPLAHQGYKGFLRFRIDAEGNLHGYMLGTDKVPQHWKNKSPMQNDQNNLPLWEEVKAEEAPQWKIRDSFVLKS